jgi:hypothetical protein
MTRLLVMDGALGDEPKNSTMGGAYIYVVPRGSPFSTVINRIAKEVPPRSCDSMSIYAHAAEWNPASESGSSCQASVLGFTLGELVNESNVHLFSKLRGLFEFPGSGICNLLACEAVSSRPGVEFTEGNVTTAFSGDNISLIKKLANNLNMYVRAADAPQKFTAKPQWYTFGLGAKLVDFGEWEGNVWMFGPDGSGRQTKNPGARF